jgi:hypothetical protein
LGAVSVLMLKENPGSDQNDKATCAFDLKVHNKYMVLDVWKEEN